jgi:hypothetical protein
MNPDMVDFRDRKDELMFDKLRNVLHKMHFVMSNDPDKLKAARPVVTIEAEYGDRVVEGSALTLAHHGPRSKNEPPCLARMIKGTLADEICQDVYATRTIGLSHTDLDSVGGILRLAECHHDLKDPEDPAMVQGWKLGDESFWKLAAFVDLNGAHKLAEYEVDDLALQQLWAWWAWEEAHPCYPKRDGSITDINDWILEAVTVLAQVFFVFGEPAAQQRFNAGRKFREAEQKLNKESFVELTEEGVCVRVAPVFTNHLYATPLGPAKAIVAYDTSTGMITVSRESDDVGFNARVLVQQLWGPEAGGHDGIAGSPRNVRMTLVDLVNARNRVNVWLASSQS